MDNRKGKRLFFQNYIVENVYHNMTEETRNEIVKFWLDQKVLSEAVANRRVSQVLFVIREKPGGIAGLVTVYIRNFQRQDNPCYFFRMFIRPEKRRSFGLLDFIVRQACLFLKNCKDDQPAPKGLVMTMENPKLRRNSVKNILQNEGHTYHGQTLKGHDIWHINLDTD